MKIPFVYNDNGRIIGIDKALKDSIEANGTYMPDVKQVIFNLKTTNTVQAKDKQGNPKTVQATDRDGTPLFLKDSKTPVMKPVMDTVKIDPVLTTVVIFADGSKVTVKNSKHDPVSLTTKKLADGTEIEVADICSLENGLAYAIAKRVMGRLTFDKNGNAVGGEGFGRLLAELTKEGLDQSYNEANAKAIVRMKKSKTKPTDASTEKVEKKPVKTKTVKKAKHAFKDLTQEQKRAYWRKQAKKRRQARRKA